MFQQILRNLFVNLKLPRIDDTHVEPGFDSVIQKRSVDGFADNVVATETETDVGNAAGNFRARADFLDLLGGFEKVDRVVIVLRHSRGDGENVWIEDNVFGREANFVHKDVVSPFADSNLFVGLNGLAVFVEGHHNCSSTVAPHQFRFLEKVLFAFLKADRVHDRFALHGAKSSFDHGPLRAVDHDRHGSDVAFAGNQTQIFRHGLFAVEQRVVHVDVDHSSSALDLVASNLNRFFKFFFANQTSKLSRAGNVCSFADHQKVRVFSHRQRTSARQSGQRFDVVRFVRSDSFDGFGDGFDVSRSCTATTAHDIQPTGLSPILDRDGHVFGGQIELTHFVWRPGIRMAADVRR